MSDEMNNDIKKSIKQEFGKYLLISLCCFIGSLWTFKVKIENDFEYIKEDVQEIKIEIKEIKNNYYGNK